jgi:hypothetical protein
MERAVGAATPMETSVGLDNLPAKSSWKLDTEVSPNIWRRIPEAKNVKCGSTDDILLTTLTKHKHEVGDYVLRMNPTSKLGENPPNKLGSFWQGPYQIVNVMNDNTYQIQNLVTGRKTYSNIKTLKSFHYNPDHIKPINIAVKDTDEFVVGHIVSHRMTGDNTIEFLVHWDGFESTDDTYEPFENLRHVDKFHAYCRQNKLNEYLPRSHKRQKVNPKP